MSALALKFLRPGAVGPFSGFAWPQPAGGQPGDWVRAAERPIVCRRAVHACRVRDLPRWLDDELWAVELDGELVEDETKLAAAAGRLVRRIEGWDGATAREFAGACAERVEVPGYAEDARALAPIGSPAAVAYVAARAAGSAGGEAALQAERAWQSGWLAERLALDGFR